MSVDVEAFRENGYAVVRGAVPAALCETLVAAIGEVSGLDADRPETWYRDPPLAWDIVPMWGHQALGTSASTPRCTGSGLRYGALRRCW